MALRGRIPKLIENTSFRRRVRLFFPPGVAPGPGSRRSTKKGRGQIDGCRIFKCCSDTKKYLNGRPSNKVDDRGGGGDLQFLYFPSFLSFLLVIVQAAGMNFVGLFGREQEPVSPLRPCACPHLLGLPVTCTDH